MRKNTKTYEDSVRVRLHKELDINGIIAKIEFFGKDKIPSQELDRMYDIMKKVVGQAIAEEIYDDNVFRSRVCWLDVYLCQLIDVLFELLIGKMLELRHMNDTLDNLRQMDLFGCEYLD
jgi:hypothetical protein